MTSKVISYKGYTDRFGMVCANDPGADTENGLLFTAVAQQSEILNGYINTFSFKLHFDDCFIGNVLYRTPWNQKPDSHDNYTGCALGALIEGNTEIPRKLLKSLVCKLGRPGGSIVGIYPQVWILLLAAAYTPMKYILYPALYTLYLLQTPGKNALEDTSGTQLQFTIVSVLDHLFPEKQFLKKWFAKLKKYGTMYQVMKIYYGEQHPTTVIWKDSTL